MKNEIINQLLGRTKNSNTKPQQVGKIESLWSIPTSIFCATRKKEQNWSQNQLRAKFNKEEREQNNGREFRV